MSYGLVDIGNRSKQNAINSFSMLDQQEQQRKANNEQMKNAKKAGLVSMAGTGAAIGTAIMPGIGTAVGAALGGIASALF